MSENTEASCKCCGYPERANIAMGFEDDDRKFFATVAEICAHGGAQWWLWLGECSVCQQSWLVAQDDRIFDEYLLLRLNRESAALIQTAQRWPSDFMRYEDVLRELGTRVNFAMWADLNDSPIALTIRELREVNSELTLEDAAALVGLDASNLQKLKLD